MPTARRPRLPSDGSGQAPSVLDAAAAAPRLPGVYFFLGPESELLYVGKAGELRRRLQQHALAGRSTRGRNRKYAETHEVRWAVLPTEADAAAFEADVIVALRPPYNAFADGRWSYIVVERLDPGRVLFSTPVRLDGNNSRRARAYGCFPHLGRGVSLRPAVVCSDGFTAFLRLLWAASGVDGHVPARLARSAPDVCTLEVDSTLDQPLHAFLAGTSPRLLTTLGRAIPSRPEFMRPALLRDLEAAFGFFTTGPQAVRALRLETGRKPGPQDREATEAVIEARVAAAIGPFSLRNA